MLSQKERLLEALRQVDGEIARLELDRETILEQIDELEEEEK